MTFGSSGSPIRSRWLRKTTALSMTASHLKRVDHLLKKFISALLR
jgi:hypothetical protein